MSEFKAITTQEELDAVIKDRLARNTKTVTDEVTKKFEGYISPDDLSTKTAEMSKEIGNLKTALSEKDNSIADLTAKNKAYEIGSVKTKIAREFNIPYELAGRLSGETEEEIKADAEIFSKFTAFTALQSAAPLANPINGTPTESNTVAALRQMVGELNK